MPVISTVFLSYVCMLFLIFCSYIFVPLCDPTCLHLLLAHLDFPSDVTVKDISISMQTSPDLPPCLLRSFGLHDASCSF